MKADNDGDKNSSTASSRKGATDAARRNQANETRIQELADRITGLTRSNRQLKRKIFDLYTSFEISRHFNSVLEYDTLLDTFILTSLGQVGASRGALFLPQEGHPDRFVMTTSKGSGSFPDRRSFFTVGSDLTTYIMKLNRPLTTGELMGDIARRGERSILECFHPGLVVPLIYQTRLTGVLIITDKLSSGEFKMEDIEFLSVLGNQISVAIENTRLYEAEKMATRQLRAAQEKLVQGERQAALGEMSAKIAHEINNPLGIIKNYLQLIRRVVGPNVEAANYTDIVSGEIDRIARIVRELLDFHRPRGMTFEPTDVKRVIEDVLTLMERKLESKGITLSKSYARNLSLVSGSPENLKQVFLNVIINACDVMTSGGRLSIDVLQQDDHLCARFMDTGPGIAPELVPRIFEPFFTTKEPGHGTGLGLSVCYGIIKNHGGSITFTNTDDGGCFTIRLPATNER